MNALLSHPHIRDLLEAQTQISPLELQISNQFGFSWLIVKTLIGLFLENGCKRFAWLYVRERAADHSRKNQFSGRNRNVASVSSSPEK